MPKPKKLHPKQKDKKKAATPAATPPMSVPVEAIPHIFNQKVLEWHKAQFNALSEIHKVLVEIRDAMKEE